MTVWPFLMASIRIGGLSVGANSGTSSFMETFFLGGAAGGAAGGGGGAAAAALAAARFAVSGDVLADLLALEHRVHHHPSNKVFTFTLLDLIFVLHILVTRLAVVPGSFPLHAIAGNEESDGVCW